MRAPTWKGHVMFLYGTWHYTQAGVVGTGDSPRTAYGNWIAAQQNSYNSAYSNQQHYCECQSNSWAWSINDVIGGIFG